jgi:hypothetical protein
LETDGPIEEMIDGMFIGQDFDDFNKWSEGYIKLIEANQRSSHPYHKLWASQRIEDVGEVMSSGFMLGVENKECVSLRRIVMAPDSYHTIFLLLDRPENGRIGQAFDIEITQIDDEKEDLIGGLDIRVELVPEPEIKERYELKLWVHRWPWNYRVIRARLYDSKDELVTPDNGAEVTLTLESASGEVSPPGSMRWHRGWRSFYAFVRVPKPDRTKAVATALVSGSKVAEARLDRL